MKRRQFLLSVILVVASLLWSSCRLWANSVPSPLDVVKSGTERVLSIVRQCAPGKPLEDPRYKQELRQMMMEYLDFDEMSRRALGRYWKKQSNENRTEFKNLFRELLFKSYVERLDNYVCGREKVIYEKQIIRGRYALVRTKVIGYKDTDVVVEYRLKKKPDGWKVYDIIVEGISLIQNYRSQFRSILSRESFESLLSKLRKKVQSGQVADLKPKG